MFLLNAINETAIALTAAALKETKRLVSWGGVEGDTKQEWTGLGVEWARSWLGAREWRVPCLDVNIRL